MIFELRKILIATETTYRESSHAIDRPTTKVAVAGVVVNPFAGAFHEDLSPLFDAAEDLGRRLSLTAVKHLDGSPESYGKAAIVGLAGEIEHAAAVLHPTLGRPLREATGGGKAIIPSTKKIGPAGTAIDVPLHYKDAAFVRSHFDAMEVRVPDAPRDNEIVVIVAVSNGGRPHPRVGGLTIANVKGEDGLR